MRNFTESIVKMTSQNSSVGSPPRLRAHRADDSAAMAHAPAAVIIALYASVAAAIALYACAAMSQSMPPLMGDDDDDDDARTVYCSHDVGMAPPSLEVWARFFATYPEALDLLARMDDALDFVD